MLLAQLQNQERHYPQLAGLIYLVIAVVGGFSIGYMPSEIVVEGDAALTFQNLLANQQLFKVGIAGDIAVLVLEVLLTVMIFRLFNNVNKTAISIATYSRLAMAVIMGINLLNYMVPAIIMTQPEYLSSFSGAELESLTLLFFRAHKYGELAWQLFFAIHLFSLGYVVQKSAETPRWLGLLMLLGGVGYGLDSFFQFILLDGQVFVILSSGLLVLAVVGELWFAFWLLLKMGTSKV